MISPISVCRRLVLASTFVGATAFPLIAAQPGSGDSSEDSLKFQPSLETSFSFDAGLDEGQRALGDINTWQWRFDAPLRFSGGGPVEWTVGPGFQRFSFSRPDGAPIPSALHAYHAILGAQWRFSEAWTGRIELQPGVYSDMEDINSGDLNVPALAGLIWRVRDNLLAVAQLSIDARRDTPAIGGIGMRWGFAPDLTLSLMVPRPQIEFRPDEKSMFFAGASLQGRTFRVAEDFGTRIGRPELNDQDVEYREIRLGAGWRRQLVEGLSFQVEGGWSVDRRFLYDDVNLMLNGAGAPFVGVMLIGTF
ncbi:MAG: hypothetical protein FJ405_14625 [Verrucomicrobia bacterium]|nr:hypothetical protein [Verrucomicrobiota bacterium]